MMTRGKERSRRGEDSSRATAMTTTTTETAPAIVTEEDRVDADLVPMRTSGSRRRSPVRTQEAAMDGIREVVGPREPEARVGEDESGI